MKTELEKADIGAVESREDGRNDQTMSLHPRAQARAHGLYSFERQGYYSTHRIWNPMRGTL